MSARPAGPVPQVVAHSGFAGRHPGNTRSAFEAAIASGADAIECDVHLTRDGEVVIGHDFTVDRTSNGHGAIAELTLAELRALRWGHERDAAPPAGGADPAFASRELVTLPQLVAMIKAAGRPLGLLVETKQPGPSGRALDEAVAAVLAEAGWDRRSPDGGPSPASVISFDPASLLFFAEAGLDIGLVQLIHDGSIGQLQGPAVEECRARAWELIEEAGRFGAGPSLDLLLAEPARFAPTREAGLDVYVWTANDWLAVREAAAAGATAIGTDHPDAALEALGRR